jgi:hypothetical protein
MDPTSSKPTKPDPETTLPNTEREIARRNAKERREDRQWQEELRRR